MKLRLHGTPAEVAEVTRRLVQVLEVVSVSQPYPDRGASVLVRVYLEVRLDQAGAADPDRAPDPNRAPGPGPAAGPGGPAGLARPARRRRRTRP